MGLLEVIQYDHKNKKELTKMVRSGQRRHMLSKHVAIKPRIAALRKINGIPINNILLIILLVLL